MTETAAHETIVVSQPEALGYMVGLCAFNGIYSDWTINSIGRLFIPPILANQFKIYFANGECVAFATWAFLSDEISDKIRFQYSDPPPDGWTTGNNLWIIDMVAPNRGVEITRDLQKSVFSERTEPGFALRRDQKGQVKKIARWATWSSCPRNSPSSMSK